MKKLLLIPLMVLFVSCAEDKKEEGSHSHSCGQVYQQHGSCGWSYDLGCHACYVQFNDGKRGLKCGGHVYYNDLTPPPGKEE